MATGKVLPVAILFWLPAFRPLDSLADKIDGCR